MRRLHLFEPLSADKNQKFIRSRMTDKERKTTPNLIKAFIIADADTGHGVMLTQKPDQRFEKGCQVPHRRSKTRHKEMWASGGKVLVPDEQPKG
jgi:isocitrate lyase